MGFQFFAKQKIDDAGVLSVRIQKFLLILLGLLAFRLLFDTLMWALGPSVNYELFVLILLALVFILGFFGAYGRNTILLLFYMLASTLFITLFVIVYIFAMAGGFAIASGLWASSATTTPTGTSVPRGVFLTFQIIALLLGLASLVLQIFTIYWTYRLRKIIKKGRRFSALSVSGDDDGSILGYRPPPPPPEMELNEYVPPPPQ